MSQTPAAVEGRVTLTLSPVPCYPGVVSHGETESNVEDVEEVVVPRQHDHGHQHDLAVEGQFPQCRRGGEEEESERDLYDEGREDAELVYPGREEGSLPGQGGGQALGGVVGGHGCQAPPGLAPAGQLHHPTGEHHPEQEPAHQVESEAVLGQGGAVLAGGDRAG